MNDTDTLELRLKTFRHSSSFTPGDPLSFSVVFDEENSLPGKFDAANYLRSLGIDLVDKNVLVVCPGNGGLCIEALKGGASTVVAMEPRMVYDRALTAISDFTSETISTTFSRRAADAKLVEQFDIVLWPEGLDEVAHPKTLFEAVVDSVAPGGYLYLEVAHGHHKKLPDSINSWRPSEEAFKETLKDYSTVGIVSEIAGRNQSRKIYTIQVSNSTRPTTTDAPRYVHVDTAVGEDRTGNETVKEFAERLQAEVSKQRKDTGGKAAPFVSKEFVQKEILRLSDEEIAETQRIEAERSDKAAKRLAEQIKGLMPTEQPVADNLDSIYEGRTSTPKSNKRRDKDKGSSNGA
ncbi:MAG: hypothetical protein AB7L09_00250 [Nitrospira sp.]